VEKVGWGGGGELRDKKQDSTVRRCEMRAEMLIVNEASVNSTSLTLSLFADHRCMFIFFILFSASIDLSYHFITIH